MEAVDKVEQELSVTLMLQPLAQRLTQLAAGKAKVFQDDLASCCYYYI